MAAVEMLSTPLFWGIFSATLFVGFSIGFLLARKWGRKQGAKETHRNVAAALEGGLTKNTLQGTAEGLLDPPQRAAHPKRAPLEVSTGLERVHYSKSQLTIGTGKGMLHSARDSITSFASFYTAQAMHDEDTFELSHFDGMDDGIDDSMSEPAPLVHMANNSHVDLIPGSSIATNTTLAQEVDPAEDEKMLSKEQLLLREFKQRLIAKGLVEELRDEILMRFLAGKAFDLNEAEGVFTRSREWRARVGVQELCDSFAFHEYQEVERLYPRYFHKTCKLGRPVLVTEFANLNATKMFQVTTEERFLQEHTRSIEKITEYRLPACLKRDARSKGQIFNILDMRGAPLSQFPMVKGVLLGLMKIDGDNYPETLGCMVIINAPYLFTAIWSFVKRFLDPNTIAKIHIVGSNFQPTLLEMVDKDCLPTYLGGTCECEGGCRHSDVGPWNDGTVPGYPIEYWESFKRRDEAARLARLSQ
ncbi:cytosolic factor, phosphatidylinositol/phosphatidylcholine transfer protein [Kappamyces sp. JEL0829]|nr:cytosolic factor, phosphatidylinositol/phosphatidylcholine transfer protein [Kappamyces sp. JEL0829]